MYNKELKNRFLQECVGDKKTVDRMRSVLNSVAKYEEQWGADICTRSKEELDAILGKVVGVRSTTRFVDLSMLRRYARWCIENDIPNATDAIFQIKDVGLEKTANTMVSSPKHLQDRLDLVFPPEHDCKIYNVSRGFLWMAFAGMEVRDTVLVTAKDVDFRNMVIRLNEKEYPIYKEAVPALRHICTADSFVYDHPRYEAIKKRTVGTSILRGVHSESGDDFETIRRMTSRRVKAAFTQASEQFDLTYKKTSLSGVFYRVFLKEQKDGECDFTEAVDLLFSNEAKSNPEKQAKVLREYEEDYNRWKAAFNL